MQIRDHWLPRLSHRIAILGLGCALASAAPCAAFAAEATSQAADQPAQAATVSEAASAPADSLSSPIAIETEAAEAIAIELSDTQILVGGEVVSTDPAAAIYTANDIVYYEDRDTYESGNVYGEGKQADRHSAEDAAGVTVLHIAQAGTYRISGTLSSGQIAVDLGDDAASDPEAVVTPILDGVDITCDVAPAIVFYNAYECDADRTAETAAVDVDTSAAGANLVIADGSVNNVTGSHVARIYKDTDEQKKLWKIDGAVYSFVSMNVDGEAAGTGVLNIYADNEGLDTEMHLSINGGNIAIQSGDDAINTNEDGVSVTAINGGTLHILAGLGSEGDGIDSNGYLVVNGGTVISMAHPASDSGLDADLGCYVNGGTVVALGSTMDWAESDSEAVTINLQFASYQDAGDAIVIADADGNIVFAYDPSEDETASAKIRQYQGAILSCANFEVGATYKLYIGGTVEGDEIQGVYDVATITGYEGGVQQGYTGTDVRFGPGGMGGRQGGMGPGGMGRPDDGNGFEGMGNRGGNQQDGMNPGGNGGFGRGPMGERPEMPEGMEPPEGFGQQDGERPEMPEGFDPQNGERPKMPEGMEPPQGFDAQNGERPTPPEGMPEGTATSAPSASSEMRTDFYMQDKVNAFSGISAVTDQAQSEEGQTKDQPPA